MGGSSASEWQMWAVYFAAISPFVATVGIIAGVALLRLRSHPQAGWLMLVAAACLLAQLSVGPSLSRLYMLFVSLGAAPDAIEVAVTSTSMALPFVLWTAAWLLTLRAALGRTVDDLPVE